jgi:hypothetical protein
MAARQLVEFIGQAARALSRPTQEVLRRDLHTVFRPDRPKAITVSQCFAGYAGLEHDKIPDKVILGVEVRLATRLETHIVKVGTVGKVGGDFDGWEQCRGESDIASRILLPVRKIELDEGRMAVLYRDAYTLYGPKGAEAPEWLETVVTDAVVNNTTDPLSVERALIHIYTDLGRWFYDGAQEKADRTVAFYRSDLDCALPNFSIDSAAADQREKAQRRWDIRRDAIWLFCGHDPPQPERAADYLDPCDYVEWALAAGVLPATLVGRSHGDLHARNILLAVQRGEASYPVVIDYGAMKRDNVVVLDFVRLETELKNHLLPQLFDDASARKALTGSDEAPSTEVRTQRAARLRFICRFEKLLDERTNLIDGRDRAESREPPGGRSATGHAGVDRLLAIVLRIRQEAALWLGYVPNGRQDRWRDEYYFALACYGLAHGRAEWHYEPRQTECALVSAGVAAASMCQAQNTLRELITKDAPCPAYPSYRVPLALAHKRWINHQIDEARAIVEAVLPAAAAPGRPSFRHAVPLVAEHALLLAEKGESRRAEALLQPLREDCRLFRDHETLSRLGRAYKDIGDRRWEAHFVPFEQLGQLPARQMYQSALEAYSEAFELTANYFPGINAAAMALLAGQPDLSQNLAKRVLDACRRLRQRLAADEAVWVFATEGEASLLLGLDSARAYYASALDSLDPSNSKMAQSMYNQLCRLWHALGQQAVEPVIREFEKREVWQRMTTGPLGDCGGRRGAASSATAPSSTPRVPAGG